MKKLVVLSVLGFMAFSLYAFLPANNANEKFFMEFVDLVYYDGDSNLYRFIEADEESKCPFLSKKKSNENECPVTGKKSKAEKNECPVTGKSLNEENLNDNSVCPYSDMNNKTGSEKKIKETVIKVRST